jgi:UDP-N-acetylmuramoyl-tripeptide--D-alanyl-D-alanine ligase
MAERGYPDTRIIVSREGIEAARLVAENVEHSLDGLKFDLRDRESDEVKVIQTKLVGLHNVTNILLAAGVARHLSVSLEAIATRAMTLQPAEHRLNINRLPNQITIIDDAYSANPVGAAHALEVLKLHEGGRRILITPGMVELGERQDEENFILGTTAAASATDIILVGIAQTEPLQRAIAETDFDPARVIVFDTFDEARQWFQAEVKAGDTVLFLNDLPDTYL